MKIIFIGGREVNVFGGIENYMLNLATQLVKMGHQPVVFCESDHNGVRRVNGFVVIHLRGLKSYLVCKPWVALKATVMVIRRMRPVDIIHYNAWPPSLWSPLARMFGVKSLMQGHGLEWKNSKYSPMQQRILLFMERVTAHINRNLIMCSEAQTRYFKERYGRDAVTVSTAINISDADVPVCSDVLERFGIRPRKYFLFLARFVKVKNPDVLIQAFNRADTAGFQLVLAGDNTTNAEYVERLHSLAEDNENIIFTGAVYGDDKEALLRNAYMFCLPSTIEGLSISLLEAMSRRTPVLASDIPGNREVLDDDSALWVRPENEDDLVKAIEQAAHNPEEIQTAVEDNYLKVKERYTWEHVAEKYIDYLSTICRH